LAVFYILFSNIHVGAQDLQDSLPPLPVGKEKYEAYGKKMRLGPFVLHPIASEQIRWCDNIFLHEEDEVSDVASVTELGIRADLVYKQKGYLLNLLKCNYNAYIEYDNESNLEYMYRADGKCKLSDIFSLDGRIDFQHRSEPVEIMFTERLDRNIVSGLVGLDIITRAKKLSFRAEVKEKNYNFYGNTFGTIDHNDFYFNGLGRYKYSEKTSFGGRLGIGDVAYTEDVLNNYKYFTVGAFAEGKLKPKLKYSIEAGFFGQMVDTENNPAYEDEYAGPYWVLGMQYDISEKCLLKTSLQRRVTYHVAVNYQVIDKLDADFKWKVLTKTTLHCRCAFELSNPSGDDETVAADACRFIGGVAGYYRIKKYLYAGLDYEFVRRLSGMADASYYANKIGAHISFAF
jgi:hypothetical protein